MNEQKLYTVVWEDSRLVGSHWSTRIEFARIELQRGESLDDAMDRENLADFAIAVLVGWPEQV